MTTSLRTKRLKSELAKLAAGQSRRQLKELWRQVYGSDPPEQISRQLLTQAIAHRLQIKARGGLSFSTRRALERATKEGTAKGGLGSARQEVETGVVLVRVWRGETHQVTRMKEGFQYRGERYGSLSEIARAITGTRWSGPRFFGLKAAGKDRVAR